MALDNKSIALLYQKRAKRYDFSANAYYLIGFREFAYRKIGVEALNLKKGVINSTSEKKKTSLLLNCLQNIHRYLENGFIAQNS